jgi:hypothetical protein
MKNNNQHGNSAKAGDTRGFRKEVHHLRLQRPPIDWLLKTQSKTM